jgi:hypothetical protein
VSDYFQVHPEDLVQHSADVQRIAQDMQVVSRVGQPLPAGAYGVVGELFTTSLVHTDGRMSESLGRLARHTAQHAQALQQTADHYQRAEAERAAALRQVYPDPSGRAADASAGAADGCSGGPVSRSGSGGERSTGGTAAGEHRSGGHKLSAGSSAGRGALSGRATPSGSIGRALGGEDGGPGPRTGQGAETDRGRAHDGIPEDLDAVPDRQLHTLRRTVDHQLSQLGKKRDHLDEQREKLRHELRGDDLTDHQRDRLEHRLHDVEHQRDRLDHQHGVLRERHDRIEAQYDRREAQRHAQHPAPAHPAPVHVAPVNSTPPPPNQRQSFAGPPQPTGSAPGLGHPSWAEASQD